MKKTNVSKNSKNAKYPRNLFFSSKHQFWSVKAYRSMLAPKQWLIHSLRLHFWGIHIFWQKHVILKGVASLATNIWDTSAHLSARRPLGSCLPGQNASGYSICRQKKLHTQQICRFSGQKWPPKNHQKLPKCENRYPQLLRCVHMLPRRFRVTFKSESGGKLVPEFSFPVIWRSYFFWPKKAKKTQNLAFSPLRPWR